MVLIRKEHEALWRAGAVFNPDWLREIADVRQMRFMNWMRTNGSTQQRWSERPQISDATWGFENGAPVEIMVRLANEIGADPWFTIPHLADDDYIRRFATYVRDNLDPRLKVFAEDSNELWNGSFQQAKYNVYQAEKGVLSGDPAEVAGQRAHHVAQIWADVFAGEAPDRLIRVFGGYTRGLTWSRRALSAKPEGAGFLSSATVADGFAVTTYFGGSRHLREAAFTAWKARGGAATDDLRNC